MSEPPALGSALQCGNPLAEIRRLLMQRHVFYEQLADACIDTTALSIEQTADAVLRLIEVVVRTDGNLISKRTKLNLLEPGAGSIRRHDLG